MTSHDLLACAAGIISILCFDGQLQGKRRRNIVEHKQRGPPGREETMHAFKGIPSPGLFNTDLFAVSCGVAMPLFSIS